MELGIDYQPAKFQCCRLSVASFIDGLKKNNDDVIITSVHVVRFENLKFCETVYRLPALQVSNLLIVWIEFYGD